MIMWPERTPNWLGAFQEGRIHHYREDQYAGAGRGRHYRAPLLWAHPKPVGSDPNDRRIERGIGCGSGRPHGSHRSRERCRRFHSHPRFLLRGFRVKAHPGPQSSGALLRRCILGPGGGTRPDRVRAGQCRAPRCDFGTGIWGIPTARRCRRGLFFRSLTATRSACGSLFQPGRLLVRSCIRTAKGQWKMPQLSVPGWVTRSSTAHRLSMRNCSGSNLLPYCPPGWPGRSMIGLGGSSANRRRSHSNPLSGHSTRKGKR